jgi:Ni/Co efflux regulator RcnB
MLKRIGTFALLLSASVAFFQPATAFAQEHYYRDRDYRAEGHWNGSRWREHRGDERREHRWKDEHRWRGEHRWREGKWREHEWREHERAERRYYNGYRYSPYSDGYYYRY